jgi:hypothetical protein
VVHGLEIWTNALRDLIGIPGNRPIREVGRKGMIGLERGGARVIGNYGMRREFEFFFTLLYSGARITPCLLFWLVLFKVVLELDYGLRSHTCWT